VVQSFSKLRTLGKGAWRLALGGALWALGRPLTGKRVKVDEDVKVVQSGSKFFKVFQS
jgi:hypothetical protein